jgi:hypothetical protein
VHCGKVDPADHVATAQCVVQHCADSLAGVSAANPVGTVALGACRNVCTPISGADAGRDDAGR